MHEEHKEKLFKIKSLCSLRIIMSSLKFLINFRYEICFLSLAEIIMRYLFFIIAFGLLTSCGSNRTNMKKVIFLHHSTGYNIWLGKTNNYLYKLTRTGDVQKYFNKYARINKTGYEISEMFFPKSTPYGWNNYPFDYYNIWVKNGGSQPYMEEPTLEILTRDYEILIFKHCYPGSNIAEDTGSPDINSREKRLENYKLQYDALKDKMHKFPENKFIVWTPAVNTKNTMSEDEAKRTREFHEWMINEWDEKGDNIFIWDFYKYETEGGLYLADKYAYSSNNPHPNVEFSARIAPLFASFIIEVIESGPEM